MPTPLAAELDDAVLVVAYPEAGVEVYQVPTGRNVRSLSDRKNALRQSPDVRFAGGVLVDPSTKEPVLYTENIFIKFVDSADPEDCEAVLMEAGLEIKEKVSYATNAFFVGAPEGTGQDVFDIANKLLERSDVEYCHPELIRPRARKLIFAQQWHLKKTTVAGIPVDAHANVEAAHELAQGAGITIAIIDDGVDIDHVEFSGSGKVVAPRDATERTNDPRPQDIFGTGPENGDNHGTACAGVACGNGTNGASGVAPKARLMPIRLASGLGSQREAEAFGWVTLLLQVFDLIDEQEQRRPTRLPSELAELDEHTVGCLIVVPRRNIAQQLLFVLRQVLAAKQLEDPLAKCRIPTLQ